jgi:hypothetical protein
VGESRVRAAMAAAALMVNGLDLRPQQRINSRLHTQTALPPRIVAAFDTSRLRQRAAIVCQRRCCSMNANLSGILWRRRPPSAFFNISLSPLARASSLRNRAISASAAARLPLPGKTSVGGWPSLRSASRTHVWSSCRATPSSTVICVTGFLPALTIRTASSLSSREYGARFLDFIGLLFPRQVMLILESTKPGQVQGDTGSCDFNSRLVPPPDARSTTELYCGRSL